MTILNAGNEYRGEGPQPLLRPIPPGAEYPRAALGPLREAVEAVQGMTLAPFAVPAQSALAVASLAVQGFADVETLSGSFSPPSIYALTIARSGERKSSCDAPLMAALREYEREQAKAQPGQRRADHAGQEKAGEEDDRPQPTATLHGRHHRAAQLEHGVALLVLQGVAHLVGGDAGRGQAVAAVHVGAQP